MYIMYSGTKVFVFVYNICITSSPKGKDNSPESHYNSMDFFRISRAVKSIVSTVIWLKLELIQDMLHPLITSKFKMDHIKSSQGKVETSIVHVCSCYLQV